MRNVRMIAAVFALACAGCSSVETAHGPGYTLTTPFSREATDEWGKRVGGELTATATFLGRPIPDPPLDVRLDPVDVGKETNELARLMPSVDGYAGWTIGGRDVHVVVDAAHEGMFTIFADSSMRHEFTHALLHGAGVHGPAWLHEGLAHEAGDAVTTADGLRLHPAPAALPVARAYAKTFDVAKLWSWDGSRRPHDEESALRTLAWSFVRFLIERDGDGWRGRVGEWASLRPGEDALLVGAWRRWLDELDFIGRIDRGVHDPDAAVRADAANALPILAESVLILAGRLPGLDAEVGPRADAEAIALASSDDAACAEAAARYLVFFRRTAVPESAVRSLAATVSPPWTRLTGLALLARRGTVVDAADAKATWERMSDKEQSSFLWLVSFLPVERRETKTAR